jgi:hypothetical protein
MARIVGGRKTARRSNKRTVRRIRHKRGRNGGGDIEEGNPAKEEYDRKTPEELAEEGRSPSPVNIPSTEEKMEEGSLFSKIFGGKRKSRRHPRKGRRQASYRANRSEKNKPYFMRLFGL